MNKACFIILFSLLCFRSNSAVAAKSPQYLLVETTTGQSIKVHNYDRFNFEDSAGREFLGKIYLFNDSEFCFVNYFYEVSSDTFHMNDIYRIYIKPARTRVIPLGVKILGALVVPYVGLAYLIVSEIHLKKRGRGASSGQSKGWYKGDEIKVSIHGFYEEV